MDKALVPGLLGVAVLIVVFEAAHLCSAPLGFCWFLGTLCGGLTFSGLIARKEGDI